MSRATWFGCYILGVGFGWVANWYLMKLGLFGFWLGFLGFLLCTATIAGAVRGFAALTGALAAYEGRPAALGVGLMGTANGAMLGASVALGVALGVVGLGSIWLGILFAVVILAVVLPVSGLLIRRRTREELEMADFVRTVSRPIRMETDRNGHIVIY